MLFQIDLTFLKKLFTYQLINEKRNVLLQLQ